MVENLSIIALPKKKMKTIDLSSKDACLKDISGNSTVAVCSSEK